MAQIFDKDPDFGREVPGIVDPNLLEQKPDEESINLNVHDMQENEDGSVDIPLLDQEMMMEGGEFLENLAEILSTGELNEIGTEYVELVEKDKEAREKRDKQYEEGLRRTGLGDDAPGGAQFEGASRVVHPILAEACVDFSARAIKELFPPNGPVRTLIEGKNEPDVIERAELKARGMNWQLTKGISEYRDELEQLLTQTPMGGSQYQKFWVEDGEIRTEFVPIDTMYLPFASSNFYRSSRVTHAQDITRFTFENRVKSGLYRDIEGMELDNSQIPDETASQKANNKIEGKDDASAYNDDGLRRVLEIYTWLEIDDPLVEEGRKAPYIITIDEYTEEVLAIYRNWEEGDAKYGKLDWFVEYKFIPWRGAYGIGLPHLIGGLSAALTGALRALMDSAHINNAATMLKLKGGRVTGQNTSVEVTQVSEIEAPAGIDDVRKIAMPMPFNPPSPVLFQLLGYLETAGKGVVSTSVEALSSVGDRTPVGTTMALIEQGSSTYAAIHARLHASQRKSLDIISRLNRTFPEVLNAVNDNLDEPLTPEDFTNNNNIQPVSDPHIFSEAQRYAQYQAVVQLSQDQTVPWDRIQLYRIGMKLLKFPYADEVLPLPPKPEHIDPVEENALATKGMPLAAHMDQDHIAHMVTHLLFATSPIFGENPLMGNPTVPALVQHCKEHLIMFYQQHAKASMNAFGELAKMNGQSSEGDVHKAVALADQQIAQELADVMPMLEKAMEIAQKLAPPPQMDPQSQVALQLGQAEIQRKTQLDQATLQLKDQEQKLKQTLEQQQQAFDQQKLTAEQQLQSIDDQRLSAQQEFEHKQALADQQLKMMEEQRKEEQQAFEQRLAEMNFAFEKQRESLQQQTEMMKNEADNRQHQITELLKNREDNETKKIIEEMKLEIKSAFDEKQSFFDRFFPKNKGQ
jgi:hypothetical protein